MGCLPNVLPGYVRVDDEGQRRRFEEYYGVRLPSRPGLTVTEMMHLAKEGRVRAMYIVGENPLLTDPNSTHVEEALKNLEFLVVQDMFLTETARLAHLVLPSTSFAEKEGTFTNTERRVLPVRRAIEPLSGSKPDLEIVCLFSSALGYDMAVKGPKDVLSEINFLVPAYAGITYERVIAGQRIQWPCPSKDHPGTKFLHRDMFVSGRGRFHPVDFLPPSEWPDRQYPFLLSTGRILFHYHTGSMTRRVEPLNLFSKEPFLEMSEEDLCALGIEDGERVRVVSRRGSIHIKVRRSERVFQGSLFLPFHFSEAAANMLTVDAVDPVSKIPEYKVCAVRVERLA
jgi:predicted molibdopterin-dependent oxidoreductase YjgC